MIAYHGSNILFDSFDDNHTLSGIGRMKFGWGTYISEKESTCIHYATKDADKRSNPDDNFVYKVQIPDKTPDTYIEWDVPVTDEIVNQVNEVLPIQLPIGIKGGELYKSVEKLFGDTGACQMETSHLLSSLGIIGMAYPRNWKASLEKRIGDYNFVIFNPKNIRIISVTQYSSDKKPLMYREL